MAKNVEDDKRTVAINEPSDAEFNELLQIMGQGVTECLASEMRELAMFDAERAGSREERCNDRNEVVTCILRSGRSEKTS